MNRFAQALGSLLLGCVVSALPVAAFAEYPDKPIHLIVPQAAGSATDTVARILANELGPQLGQSIIVEDRPGGALTIGIDLVAKSRARRLHARRRADRRAGHHPAHGGEAALQHREGLAADRADRARPPHARGRAEVANSIR